jgi:hypothetical protein
MLTELVPLSLSRPIQIMQTLLLYLTKKAIPCLRLFGSFLVSHRSVFLSRRRPLSFPIAELLHLSFVQAGLFVNMQVQVTAEMVLTDRPPTRYA